ncbi:IS66 family insertion sequence element accessory protein TnpB [Paraburkholderia panacisoli]|uniref:IS66 family insertion sequence element accessory protein TnpB n=2 Tax=Paraburkholderia panacisoli TaxID=2603818 RepID=A0A5B0GMQ7_9BURK|nr:IS66 family insertion sequence element accessory protein TnpB [Paraburkholderia panacisoli]
MFRTRCRTRERDGCRIGSVLMFRFEADLKVFLHREPIDFRAGINSLVALVEQSMQLDPFARAVFAFHNRRRNRVKLLLYERTGFWLLLRRLEQDHFVWPRQPQAVIELTTEQLHWLLEGIDVDAVRRHPSRRYRHAS